MATKTLSLALVLLLAAAAGAGSTKVYYRVDPSANFSKFLTYTWAFASRPADFDPSIEESIMKAVNAELAARGLKEADSGVADVRIGYSTEFDTEKRFYSFDTYFGSGPHENIGPLNQGGWVSTVTIRTLQVYIYDQSNGKLIWRGLAIDEINPKAKTDKQRKSAMKSVAELLKNYPPKEKTKK